MIKPKQNYCKPGIFFRVLVIILFIGIFSNGYGREEERTINVSIRTNLPPFSFMSWSKSGANLRGLNIDLLSQVANSMGVKFKYIKCSSLEMERNYLKKGKVDIIGMAVQKGKRKNLWVPMGYQIRRWIFVHKSCKTVVCIKDLSNKRVAILEGTAVRKRLKDAVNIDIHPFVSSLEALDMLNKGMVDAYIAPSEKISGYLIQKQRFQNIRKVGIGADPLEMGVLVHENNVALFNELTEASKKLHESKLFGQIKNKWYGRDFKLTFFERHRHLISGAFLAFVLALGFVVTLNHQLKRKVKIIKKELVDTESRYRNLIESSPDMIFVINRQGKILHMNHQARFFLPLALTRSNVMPYLKDIFGPGEKKSLESFLESVFSKKKTVMEFQVKDRQSGYSEIDIAATLLPVENGEDRACLFARDVTQRNKIEQDLVQADRMAIIGQMAADVAHEINNPIGIVLANIDLILTRGWFTPEAKECLDACYRNTVRAGDFTRDLLAMARPKTPEMRELNLWDLLSSTLNMMGAQLKRIKIIKIQKGDPPVILGDWNLLQQVLVNLLLNAVAAMKQVPGPELKITCCAPEGFGMARVRIEDKGVGIPKLELNKVFEPFFTKGKKEGFGLGLFISKRIIKNHDGIIYAESEMNKGTQFIIEMPLIENNINGDGIGVLEDKELNHER